MQPQGMQPQGMQPQGMQPPGMQPPGMQPQGMQPPGMQPPGMQPQGMQPQGTQPQGVVSSFMATHDVGGFADAARVAAERRQQLAEWANSAARTPSSMPSMAHAAAPAVAPIAAPMPPSQTVPSGHQFARGDVVLYTDRHGDRVPAQVLSVHHETVSRRPRAGSCTAVMQLDSQHTSELPPSLSHHDGCQSPSFPRPDALSYAPSRMDLILSVPVSCVAHVSRCRRITRSCAMEWRSRLRGHALVHSTMEASCPSPPQHPPYHRPHS